jgi:hypothetical protein
VGSRDAGAGVSGPAPSRSKAIDPEDDTVAITIRLDRDVLRRLDEHARRERRSRNQQMLVALDEWFRRHPLPVGTVGP